MIHPALAVDLVGTPFSVRGSYYSVRRGERARALLLRTVHGDAGNGRLMEIELAGSSELVTEVRPGLLTASTGESAIALAFVEAGGAILRVERGEVVLHLDVADAYDTVIADGDRSWRFVRSGVRRNYSIQVDGGQAVLETAWDSVRHTSAMLRVSAGLGGAMVRIEEFVSSPSGALQGREVGEVAAVADRDFEEWLGYYGGAARAGAPDSAVRLAAYVTWSALVPAGGLLTRESMLMSKNNMTHIWSWDHCFNALALWREPEAALDQLLCLFDHQDAGGALPDHVDDSRAQWNFVKPPVHGWTIGYLMDRGALDRESVARLYEPLERWTRWWFAHRDYSGAGTPAYNHGNDSGWDNATIFTDGVAVEGPDLLAFLALQMHVLARMARVLGQESEAAGWEARARVTIDRMLERFWRDGRFVARESLTQREISSDSLITLMPLVLGDQLPREVFEACVARLLEAHLTEHGLATEPVASEFYEGDGYWRGPIWAPSTMLIADGLRRGGQDELALGLASLFAQLCVRSGMAENFDAVTGEGLRDRSMTWTASVFLAMTDPQGPFSAGGSSQSDSSG